MAKQAGPLLFSGTIDNLTFYIMNGKGYVKQKSCLTGKRVKTDPQFENTRRNAKWFGRGAQLASPVYWKLPPQKREGEGVMGKLTARASALIRQGLSEEAVVKQLSVEWLGKNRGALSLSRWKVEAIGNGQQAISNGQQSLQRAQGARGESATSKAIDIIPLSAASDPEMNSG